MGKTQSKRSVDITTETKKGSEEEVTGKLEKIEDVDQKHVNGDATPQENNEAEKKDVDESENDKDLTTEKSGETPNGENGEQNSLIMANAAGANAGAGGDSPKEEVAANTTATTTATKEGTAAAVAEEISPLSENENVKKSKKEKVKKKWSFRSISFGKKDKQKPAKTEETADTAAAAAGATTATAATTNGEPEKAAIEEATETSKKNEGGAGADADAEGGAKPNEKLENGEATEKELNGLKTPTPTEEKSADIVNAATTAAAAAAAATNETNTSAATSPVNVPTASNETAIENLTENKTAAAEAAVMDVAAAAINNNASSVLSNGAGDGDKNGIIIDALAAAPTTTNDDDVVVKETVVKSAKAEPEDVSSAAAVAAAAIIENKSIPNAINDGCDGDKPHQNGTNNDGDDDEPEQPKAPAVAAEQQQSKSQIEVNTNNIANNIPATNLASSLSTNSSDQHPIVQVNNSNHFSNVDFNSKFSNSIEKSFESVVAVAGCGNENGNDNFQLTSADASGVVVVPLVYDANKNEKEQKVKEEEEEEEKDVDVDDDNCCRVVNDAQCESQPPPLPISPPPSQVSVFAFNDNTESVDDISTGTSVLVSTTAITVPHLAATQVPLTIPNQGENDENPSPEPTSILDAAAISSTAVLPAAVANVNEDQHSDVGVVDNKENAAIIEPQSVYQAEQSDEKVVELKPETPSLPATTAAISEETKLDEISTALTEMRGLNTEEIGIALAVVNEITEQAANIVKNQQLAQQFIDDDNKVSREDEEGATGEKGEEVKIMEVKKNEGNVIELEEVEVKEEELALKERQVEVKEVGEAKEEEGQLNVVGKTEETEKSITSNTLDIENVIESDINDNNDNDDHIEATINIQSCDSMVTETQTHTQTDETENITETTTKTEISTEPETQTGPEIGTGNGTVTQTITETRTETVTRTNETPIIALATTNTTECTLELLTTQAQTHTVNADISESTNYTQSPNNNMDDIVVTNTHKHTHNTKYEQEVRESEQLKEEEEDRGDGEEKEEEDCTSLNANSNVNQNDNENKNEIEIEIKKEDKNDNGNDQKNGNENESENSAIEKDADRNNDGDDDNNDIIEAPHIFKESSDYVSSTKEIANNALDIKENAAAAEVTTQDLPVTCE